MSLANPKQNKFLKMPKHFIIKLPKRGRRKRGRGRGQGWGEGEGKEEGGGERENKKFKAAGEK